MTEEIWKPVFCGENEYKISSNGRIWSCISKRIMKQHTEHCGYSVIKLSGGHGHGKNFFIHKLVAEAFLPNQNGLPEVNHKDENPLNNQSDNLEWCEHKYNIKYGTRTAKVTKKRNKAVVQFDQTGKRVGEYCSASDIEKVFGFSQGHISDCCNGKRKSAYGYVWQYK